MASHTDIDTDIDTNTDTNFDTNTNTYTYISQPLPLKKNFPPTGVAYSAFIFPLCSIF